MEYLTCKGIMRYTCNMTKKVTKQELQNRELLYYEHIAMFGNA